MTFWTPWAKCFNCYWEETIISFQFLVMRDLDFFPEFSCSTRYSWAFFYIWLAKCILNWSFIFFILAFHYLTKGFACHCIFHLQNWIEKSIIQIRMIKEMEDIYRFYFRLKYCCDQKKSVESIFMSPLNIKLEKSDAETFFL